MPQQHTARGRATAVMVTGQRISVIYHNTVVVERDADGNVTLDSGGWRTSTTKTRMNQASNQFGLGYSVAQRAGQWLVSYKGEELPFSDGMRLEA